MGLKKKSNDEYIQITNLQNKDQLNTFVEKRIKQLILHANIHTKYYQQIFDQIDLIRDDTVDFSCFGEIPILTKEIIKERHQDLISDDYRSRKWFYNSSGGSTGEPIKFIQDDVYLKYGLATNYYYFKNILDIEEPKVKKVILWGSGRDLFKGSIGLNAKINNWFSNTVFLNSLRMTREDMEQYIHTINTFKPEIVRGYAGSLFELCRYSKQKKIPITPPKIVVSAAENLTETMRNVIESTFGTKVYDFYGSREVSNIAGECKNGLMHSFLFWNYLEILDKDNQPVREGDEGRVVVTNLYNYSMPLIRYEIGDMAILGPDKCSCGQVLPTLKKVNGRILERFMLKNGSFVHAGFFGLLFDKVFEEEGIEKWQVIQEDYDKILINIVTSKEITDQFKNDLDKKIRVGMGSECKIKWNIVDDIPKTPSGKYLNTHSLIWK